MLNETSYKLSNLAQKKKSIPRDLIQVGGSGIVITDGE